MNVMFGVRTLHPQHVEEMRRLSTAAIDYVHQIHPDAATKHGRHDGHSATVYNSNRAPAWKVPTYYERDGCVLSFSAPPIPLDRPVTPDSYAETAWSMTSGLEGLLATQPNYCGIRLDGDRFTAWNDSLGLGRCYKVESRRFLAVSNHIGVLAHFLDERPTADEECWQLFAAFGWFVGHRTGIRGIERVAPASVVVCERSSIKWDTYADYDGLAARRRAVMEPAVVADQLQTLTRNAHAIMTATPRVFLSGGRDSRLTAACWLSAGNAAVVHTNGTLAEEAVVASRLMAELGEVTDLAAQGVTYEIVHPTPSSVTQSIRERATRAMAFWDGDYPPSSVKSNVADSSGSRVTIGGGGGEIAHGHNYSYSSSQDLEKIAAAKRPIDRVTGNAPWRVCTDAAQESARAFLDAEAAHASHLGRVDASSLDLFYLRQRFRRWVMAGHDTAAVVMFAAPAFVRMAFDLSPEERIGRVAHVRLTGMFVPAWAHVPYYKPQPGDLKQITARGLRIWQDEDSADHLYQTISDGNVWPNYLRRNNIEQMADIARSGDAVNPHEQWFHRLLWIEAFEGHLSRLSRQVATAWSTARP